MHVLKVYCILGSIFFDSTLPLNAHLKKYSISENKFYAPLMLASF